MEVSELKAKFFTLLHEDAGVLVKLAEDLIEFMGMVLRRCRR